MKIPALNFFCFKNVNFSNDFSGNSYLMHQKVHLKRDTVYMSLNANARCFQAKMREPKYMEEENIDIMVCQKYAGMKGICGICL